MSQIKFQQMILGNTEYLARWQKNQLPMRGTGGGRIEGGRGREAGTIWGRKSGSRNKKGTRLLFIAAYNPVKNQFLANFFDFHLTRRKIKFYKQENVMNILTSMSRNVTVEILEPTKRQTIDVPVQ